MGNTDLFAGHDGIASSIEVWPARTEVQAARLEELLKSLGAIAPDFITVTYGAMGSSRSRTVSLIENLIDQGVAVVAHLACLGNSQDELIELIHHYQRIGVAGILALRGDPPLDGDVVAGAGDLRYASELVDLVKSESDLPVAVALHPDGHPDSVDLESDRRYAAEKLSRADLGLTQFFFSYQSFARLREAMIERGVTTPIVPGIMVPATPKQLGRMAQIAGLEIPDELAAMVAEPVDRGVFRLQALEAALALARRAIADGARGIHLFSMNNARVSEEFFARLGSERTQGER